VRRSKTVASSLQQLPDGPRDHINRHMQREARVGTAPDGSDVIDRQFVNWLVDCVSHLEKQSRPSGEKGTAKDKDGMVQEALARCGWLVQHLAGWAIDHQRGLAIRGLENVYPYEMNMPAHEKAKAVVDDHEHEAIGAVNRATALPVGADRKYLINILEPLRFGLDLPTMTTFGLRALDFGEVVPLFQKAHSNTKRRYREQILKLRAIQYVEYEHSKGVKLTSAQEVAASCFNVEAGTIRSWSYRLPKTLGAIFFEREMSFARDSGKKFKKDHPHPQFGEENYSLANLKTAGKMYRQLLKDKQT
jgi:hypothetical protein